MVKKVARLESRQTPLVSTSNGLNGFYKHINSWIPAPCFAKASQGIGYNMQGLGQAAEGEPS